ncbi:SafA/ExsA family spore coat assembly protein [Amphibacillus sediminis]|uniref:SafA/ExsA family spore coat assembly protein n=1 Tax=Amphibacillus sediminis TaxID=360185 RepID=UPI00082B097B|nr:SafA/ExsA family spore coat assembly protein [Amphibacillus sediminis]
MKIHIVQKGDTLWNLAKKYNVDFQELKDLNSQLANPDLLMPGMKIKIPTEKKMVQKEGTKEQVITPYKPLPQKAQPVIKEDDHKAKKEVPKQLPKKQVTLPKLPSKPIQLPKLPNIYSTHFNIDVDIEDNDKIYQHQTIQHLHHHEPPKETKPVQKPDKKEKKEEQVAPEMGYWPVMPYCYVWTPCMPVMPQIQTNWQCQPYPNECHTFADPAMFHQGQYYPTDQHHFPKEQKWGEVEQAEDTPDHSPHMSNDNVDPSAYDTYPLHQPTDQQHWGNPNGVPGYAYGQQMPQMSGYDYGQQMMPQMSGYDYGQQMMPQMSGYDYGQQMMPQMSGYDYGQQMMPQMTGYDYGQQMMPQMSGYDYGQQMMPQMPGYDYGQQIPQMPGYDYGQQMSPQQMRDDQ